MIKTQTIKYSFTLKRYKKIKGVCSVFYREKKVDCTDYREVDIIPRTDNAERNARGKRGKREKESLPKQKDLNDRNSRRYLVQLGNGNFGRGDSHVSCTYDNEHLPTVEEGERIINNYLRRIAYRREKKGLEPLRYILVTEYEYGKDGTTVKRIHHHIIMNGGLDRLEIKAMWTQDRINWRKFEKDPKKYIMTIKMMGWVNEDWIQTNENGIEAVCKYITKKRAGKKRWSSSRNLTRPIPQRPADHKYSKAQVERLARLPDAGRSFFEKQFKNYNIVSIDKQYYKDTGWHIYLKMWRKNPKPPKNQKKTKSDRRVIPKRE